MNSGSSGDTTHVRTQDLGIHLHCVQRGLDVRDKTVKKIGNTNHDSIFNIKCLFFYKQKMRKMRESHCTEHTQLSSLNDSRSLTELTAIWRTAGRLARQVVSKLVTKRRNNPTKMSNHERPKSRTLRLLCMCTTTSATPRPALFLAGALYRNCTTAQWNQLRWTSWVLVSVGKSVKCSSLVGLQTATCVTPGFPRCMKEIPFLCVVTQRRTVVWCRRFGIYCWTNNPTIIYIP